MSLPTSIVVISRMYPRSNRSYYGAFVSEQVKALREVSPETPVTVVSPVQYAPALFAAASERWRRLRQTERSRVDFGDVPVWFPRYLSLPKKALRSLAAWACYRQIASDPGIVRAIEAADVLIAHSALFDGRVGRLLARRFGKEYWVYIHGEDLYQNTYRSKNVFKRRGIGSVLSGAAGVVTVSSHMKGEIDRAYGTAAKSHVNHNGVDLATFDGSPKTPGVKPSLVSAGYLVPRKAHRYVLEALAILRAEGLELEYEIAGDGAQRKDLEALVARLGLRGTVTFDGAYEHASLPDLLRRHDLFVLPSWDEAFGVVYVEAMAMGLPVIAANDAGAPDIVTDGVDGFLVPPKDGAAVAAAIRRYAELTDAEKAAMSEMARKTAERFTWLDNARRLLGLVGGSRG